MRFFFEPFIAYKVENRPKLLDLTSLHVLMCYFNIFQYIVGTCSVEKLLRFMIPEEIYFSKSLVWTPFSGMGVFFRIPWIHLFTTLKNGA